MEGKPLVSTRIEGDGEFVDYQWMLKKIQCCLLVLSSNRIVRYFQEDSSKDPIEIKIDFISMNDSIKVISTARQVAKDIDDTFGFGGIGGNDKIEKELLGQGGEDDKNYMMEMNSKKDEAQVPHDPKCSALAANGDGFIVAATGGLVCYYRASDIVRVREHGRSMFYNTQSFQLKGVKDERIDYISTDSKFKMVSLILVKDVNNDNI